jgi:hypothetical protein
MMRAAILLLTTCALVVAGCGQPVAEVAADAAAETATDGVHMDAETQARMSVRAEALAASTAPQTAEGFARVMDVGSLAAIESEISAAEAAASASQEEYRRLAALAAQDQAASARSVEAARAQAAADTARAKLAGRRVGLEWGASLERMSDGERSRLLTDVAAGLAALLRIDAPSTSAKITKASVRLKKGGAPIDVAIIGQAAAADARLQTTGLLGLVRGDAAATLPTGRLLQADLELGAAETGFLIPASALIRADGAVLVYVKTGDDTFARRDVGAGRAVAHGWFISEGFAAGDQVVIDGAASLLAAEHGPIEAE